MEIPRPPSPLAGASILRPCATCRKPDSVNMHSFKNCDSCREKNRLKYDLAQQRKKERLAPGFRFARLPPSDDPMESENRRLEIASGATKRKALDDLGGEDQRTALGSMKNGLKQAVKGNKRVVSAASQRVINTAGLGKEYLTASFLYESLKKKVKKTSSGDGTTTNFLNFRGFHSIVADSTIDNQKRVDMVANDLSKVARLPFELSKPHASYDFETMSRTLSFKCACLGIEPAMVPNSAVPATTIPSAKLTGTQGDLIRQARVRAAVEAISSRVERVCGGTIAITAVDDGRHPLGILGQRISISVEHPTSSSK